MAFVNQSQKLILRGALHSEDSTVNSGSERYRACWRSRQVAKACGVTAGFPSRRLLINLKRCFLDWFGMSAIQSSFLLGEPLLIIAARPACWEGAVGTGPVPRELPIPQALPGPTLPCKSRHRRGGGRPGETQTRGATLEVGLDV